MKALVLLSLAACGGAEPRPIPVPVPTQERPPLGPLADLLPATPKLVVMLRPRSIFEDAVTRHVAESVFDARARDRFAGRTGIELVEVEEGILAEYEEGTIILARGPWPASDVVLASEVRMNTVELRVDEQDGRTRRTGWIGTDRYDFAALDEHVLFVAQGAVPEAVELLDRVDRGEFERPEEGAFATAESRDLLREHQQAPLVVHSPSPLELSPDTGLGLLLARERALAVRVERSQTRSDALHVAADIRGEFPESATDNFRHLVESMSRDGLGAALGIEGSIETLRIQVDGDRAQLSMDVDANALARGLAIVVGGDLWELVRGAPEST